MYARPDRFSTVETGIAHFILCVFKQVQILIVKIKQMRIRMKSSLALVFEEYFSFNHSGYFNMYHYHTMELLTFCPAFRQQLHTFCLLFIF